MRLYSRHTLALTLLLTLSAAGAFFAPRCEAQQGYLKLKVNALLFGRDTSAARRTDSSLVAKLPLGSMIYDISNRAFRLKWDSTANYSHASVTVIPDSLLRFCRSPLRLYKDVKGMAIELIPSWKDSVTGGDKFVYFETYATFRGSDDSGYTGFPHYFKNGVAYQGAANPVFGYVVPDTVSITEITMSLFQVTAGKYADTTFFTSAAADVPAGQMLVLEYMPAQNLGLKWQTVRALKKDLNSDLVTDLMATSADYWNIPRRWGVIQATASTSYLWLRIKMKLKT